MGDELPCIEQSQGTQATEHMFHRMMSVEE